MSEEKSSLVEETVSESSTKEENNSKDFNPLAFVGDTEVAGTSTEEKTETEIDDEGEPVTDEDGWKWEKKEEESEGEEKIEEDYEWEGSENTKNEENLDWEKVAKELGIEGATKEEVKATLETFGKDEETKTEKPSSPEIETLENYLTYSNKELVIEELKAEGLSESEIDDTIDKMQRNGLITIKGREIKRTIKKAIETQKEELSRTITETKAAQEAKISEARKGLQTHLKDMERFMGGKVTKKQKEEVYRFATKDMAKEIWASHANVADVAMFLLYKDQIKEILRSQGRNEGSKSLMDKIQSPSLSSGKNRNPYQPKGKGFDPSAFMSE
jgi:hypothetical protein